MVNIITTLLLCGVAGLIIGITGARFRCLIAAIIASASIGFFPAAFILMGYHGPHSVLSVAVEALFVASPFAVVSVEFAMLGYFLVGRLFKEQTKNKYPKRHLNIVLIIIASLMIPTFIAQDFIPPPRASRADYYEMLLDKQLNKIRHDYFSDEYELNAGDRVVYVHIRYANDNGRYIWLDIYDETNAGNTSVRPVQPVFKFPRIEDWMPFPDIRGAFLHEEMLYYNYGRDKEISKSAINSRLSRRYYARDFQFAKIDLTTMQNISIDKSEYEQMYMRVKEE